MSFNGGGSNSNAVMSQVVKLDERSNIVLIGEAGAGKSTFINYLCNYFLGGTLSYLRIAIPSKHHRHPTERFTSNESEIKDTKQLKTNGCHRYLFTDITSNKQYLFLDTPGLSDTRGVEQNDLNMSQIVEAIVQLGQISTIIFVVNGSTNRISSSLKFANTYLHANLPDRLLNHVIILLTNVKQHESALDLRALNFHGDIYPFYMQNDVFVSDPRTWSARIREQLQTDWSHSMLQIQQILQIINTLKPQPVDIISQMEHRRNEWKASLHRFRLELGYLLKLLGQLIAFDSVYGRSHQNLNTYRDRLRRITFEKVEIIDAQSQNLLCNNCNYTCHVNYRSTGMTNTVFVMPNGTCQRCVHHCSMANHYQMKKAIRVMRETLLDALINAKVRWNQVSGNQQHYPERTANKADLSTLLQRVLEKRSDDVTHKSMKLMNICSWFNFTQAFEAFVTQLSSEIDSNYQGEIRKELDNIAQKITKLSESIETSRKNIKQKPGNMQIVDKDQTTESDTEDVAHMKTIELIDLHSRTTKSSLISSILHELHRRAQGKSISPVSTTADIMAVNKLLEKHKEKTVQELSYTHHQLQKQINTFLNRSILDIVRVPIELLMENFAVSSQLDEREKGEVIHRGSSQYYPPSSTFPEPSHSPPTRRSSVSLPDLERDRTLVNPIGFAHLTSPPYPTTDKHPMIPTLPDNFPPSDLFKSLPVVLPPNPKSSDAAHHAQMPRGSSEKYLNIDKMPSPSFHLLSSAPHLNNQSVTPRSSNASVPDRPSTHSLKNQPTATHLSSQLNSNEIRGADLHFLSNACLVTLYNNAVNKQDQNLQKRVIEILEQRCFGDFPQLIAEKENLFQEIIRRLEGKTTEQLMFDQAIVTKNIRKYLNLDDFTMIDNVPTDLIVEAAAFNHLVRSKLFSPAQK